MIVQLHALKDSWKLGEI